jgi:GNAT superfamily N-acetyltransferase
LNLVFRPLDKTHDRAGFSSGSAILDRWFRDQASQDERRGVARTIVASDDQGAAGFYTLSMFSVSLDSIPPEVARRLPKYADVPAALIGRLARAQRLAGRGIGELLVLDAFERIATATQTVAAVFIVVDAKDEKAALFYRRLGFIAFPARPSRLFMLTQTGAAALRRYSK